MLFAAAEATGMTGGLHIDSAAGAYIGTGLGALGAAILGVGKLVISYLREQWLERQKIAAEEREAAKNTNTQLFTTVKESVATHTSVLNGQTAMAKQIGEINERLQTLENYWQNFQGHMRQAGRKGRDGADGNG